MSKEPLTRNQIAKRVADDINDGEYANLGIGIPTLISNYVSSDREVIYHSENGVLGMGNIARPEEEDPELINASKQLITVVKGASFFHHADSFSMLRGQHVDVAIIGGMQVSENGDLANWKVKGKRLGSIGGAMDIAIGAKKVFVAMTHTNKSKEFKIVNKLSYPATGLKCVDKIYTDYAVIEVTQEGLLLTEIAPGYSIEEVQKLTEPKLIISRSLKEINI